MNKALEYIKRIDERISNKVEENQHPLLAQFFQSITSLGSINTIIILVVFLLSFQQINLAKEVSIGFTVTWIIIYILKRLVKRRRPKYKPVHLIKGGSFPSGHSATAFTTATILASQLNRKTIFFTLAILVATSRIYLKDHYASDAATGTLIGIIIGTLTTTLL